MDGEVVYDEVGSSEGIARIKTGAVDYGASDMPLDQDELERHGLIQVPTLIGGVVVVVNLPGIKPGDLVFSGAILADLFLGNIRSWADPAIKELNDHLAVYPLSIRRVPQMAHGARQWRSNRLAQRRRCSTQCRCASKGYGDSRICGLRELYLRQGSRSCFHEFDQCLRQGGCPFLADLLRSAWTG